MVDNLFLLAMDHRDSLQKDVYGIDGEPTPAEVAQIGADKLLVFAGLQKAIEGGVDAASAGVLVDERYGAEVARRARTAGIDLAMPVERSGQELFTLEYGTLADGEWIDHIAEFDPDQVKVLVRDNPDDDPVDRAAQFHALANVSLVLEEAARTFIVELLVPASTAQLASVGGDVDRYDSELRPGLTSQVISDFQQHAVEPTIWKIEGLESGEAARAVVASAQQGGRSEVRCIVLGRDAPFERLDHWLEVAAEVPGFIGFAIGRSIWEKPLREHLGGGSDDDFVDAVAANYTHFAGLWSRGGVLPGE